MDSICPNCTYLRRQVDALRDELGAAQLINEGLLERLRTADVVLPNDLVCRVLGVPLSTKRAA